MKKVVALLSMLMRLTFAEDYVFPDNFLFGVATASYQVEGAWNVSGKGENIWDRLTHTNPQHIADQSNGDVACDAYHKIKEDVQLLKSLGVNFYRFSISWSRLLPKGYSYNINPDGVRYYNELIDELLANDITPMVTLYHWDLPQNLQEIGGWSNPLLVDYFVDYVNVAFSNFGDRVKQWITFNEPTLVCKHAYGVDAMAPAYNQSGVADYLCGHALLLAHAKAYHLYDTKYRSAQKGKIGIACETFWFEPLKPDNPMDVEAAESALQMNFGWFVHPILSKSGDYPPIMRTKIDTLSKSQGFTRSRLPHFTQDEIASLKGTSDFLGLNHYTTRLCTSAVNQEKAEPSNEVDTGARCDQDPKWETAASSWLSVVPWGFRKLLNWIKTEYGNPEVIITENGVSDTGEVNDCRRINYYNSYLTEVLKAIYEDGCNISTYTAWSFMDNFEWIEGYTEKFGLYSVDFEDPQRPRTPKMSSQVYSNIISSRRIDWSYTPKGFPICDWSNNASL